MVFRAAPSQDLSVGGVVSYLRFRTVAVLTEDGRDTGTRAEVNAGIVIANEISHAIELAAGMGDGAPITMTN
jgi:hypothetical protein